MRTLSRDHTISSSTSGIGEYLICNVEMRPFECGALNAIAAEREARHRTAPLKNFNLRQELSQGGLQATATHHNCF